MEFEEMYRLYFKDVYLFILATSRNPDTAEEITQPEGYSLSPDVSKTKQTFVWDGKTDVALVFENDAKVKIRLIKKDDSDNPLPGAVFNIVKDGQIIGTEATKADGGITVTDVTEHLIPA